MMRMMRAFPAALAAVALGVLLWLTPAHSQSQAAFVYFAPQPDAELVSAATTVVVRANAPFAPGAISAGALRVRGNESGSHAGDLRLADDGRTLIFAPARPFTPGESVEVVVAGGLQTVDGAALPGMTYAFEVSPRALNAQGKLVRTVSTDKAASTAAAPPPAPLPVATRASAEVTNAAAGPRRYFTVPDDFPVMTVTVPANDTAPGYLFMANFAIGPTPVQPYLIIADNAGEPLFFRRMTPGNIVADFKRQPNGLLTYYDMATLKFMALDESYQIVGSYEPGNGYAADLHDFLMLPNGHKVFMIYDDQPVDMSRIVAGGQPTATVTGLIIQELDVADNVVFEWRSWDHIPITDANPSIVDLTASVVDYIHGNAVEVDADDNYLISSRHIDEITKVSRETGAIIWRMGGKQNEFTFIDDPLAPFGLQHDIRRLPNGHVTLFDNRAEDFSRAVEYALDETAKTATLVWSHENEPGIRSAIMGNTQRHANGNTVVNWASNFPTLVEVAPDGSKAFELTLARPNFTYRALRFAWTGAPAEPPALAVTGPQNDEVTLFFSWNGATEVARYAVYGGPSADELTRLTTTMKTSFESQSILPSPATQPYFYRVDALDAAGSVLASSPVTALTPYFMPLVLNGAPQ